MNFSPIKRQTLNPLFHLLASQNPQNPAICRKSATDCRICVTECGLSHQIFRALIQSGFNLRLVFFNLKLS